MCQRVNVFWWSYLLKQKRENFRESSETRKGERILDILHRPVMNQIFKTRVRTPISSERSCYSFFSWNALHRHLLGQDSNIFLSLHKLPDSSEIISGSSWKCLKCRHAGFLFLKKGFVLASRSPALFSLCGWPTVPASVLLIAAFINGKPPPSRVPRRFFLLRETSQLPSGIGGSLLDVLGAQGLFLDVLCVLSLSCRAKLRIIQPVPSSPGTLLSQDHRSSKASPVGYWSNDLGPLTPAKPE